MTNENNLPKCPDCGETLERLQACGAKDYWCPKCNELKSKKRIKIEE